MRKLLRKILTVSLCAALVGGTAVSFYVLVPDSSITASAATNGDYEYEVLDDGTVEITEYNGSGGVVTIPSTIDGKNVTSIGDWAFKYCDSLTSITIPYGVTSIGREAFSGCECFTNVKIPSSVTSIGDSAFEYCGSLTSITIPPSVTSIGNFAFYTCKSLISVTVPSSVTEIGGKAFGYYYDSGYKKIDGFTIYGKIGSAAETYANENGFEFVDITLKNKSSVNANSVYISDTVTINGSAEYGEAPYTYAYYYKKSTDSTWTKIAGYSTATSKTFKPTTAGTYNVRVNVKDSTGETVKKDFTVMVKAESPLSNNSSVSSEFVTANTAVTLIGNADGGIAPYTYAYYFKKSTDSAWTKIAGYSTDTSKTFKPTSAGTYIARVNVKDSTGTLVQKDFTVTVKAEPILSNNSSVGATTVKAGAEVTMTGKATGGAGSYKYAYYYKKSTDSTWTKAYVTSSGSAYTENTSVSFKPTTDGTYTVRINVKDNNGTGAMVSKDFTLKVTADTALKNNSAVSATTVTAGTEVTLTGKAEGGTSPYKYAYYYKKSTDSSWTKAYVTSSGSAYTKYDSVTFKPTTAGTYDVRINVKDEYGNGKVVTKDFKITVK